MPIRGSALLGHSKFLLPRQVGGAVKWQSFGLILALLVLGFVTPGNATLSGSTKNAKLAQLFKLQGFSAVIEQQRQACKKQAEAMKPQIMQQLKKTFPDDKARFWGQFEIAYERFEKASQPSWTVEEATDYYAKLYGKHVSEQDLDQILAFYRSPVGKKDIEASNAAISEWTAFLMKRNQGEFQRHYQAFLKDISNVAKECAEENESKDSGANLGSRLLQAD
jgi:hypothetical protein